MSRIIYIGYYGKSENPRASSPACDTVMDYVSDSINNAGHNVTIFSPAQLSNGEACEKEAISISVNKEIIFMESFKRYSKKNIPMRLIQKLRREKCLEKELMSLINDGDTVIAYHSLALMNVISKLRKKKSFKLILQVCEIYADVTENKKIRKKEIAFIDKADSYIFISNLLAKQINDKDKSHAVCYGTYKAEKEVNKPQLDGKIHVLYAGTLDMIKGGAFASVSSAEYLDEDYHIHVLGFGSEGQISSLNEHIEKVKAKTKCEITYDGCLSEEEYTKFVQGCHIGLSTQNPQGNYNATSFPSKILVYLSNGLKVVSVKIPAVEDSPVGDSIFFYEGQEPKKIAEAIRAIDFANVQDSRKVIKQLDEKFVKEIGNLLA